MKKDIRLSKKQSPIFLKEEKLELLCLNKVFIKNDDNNFDNFIVEDSKIENLLIDNLKCKNIIFRNCIIEKGEIKNLKCDRIDFIDCQVNTHLSFFKNQLNTINIENLKSNKIKFIDLDVSLLNLIRIKSDDVEIDHITQSKIQKIFFKDSDILSNVYIKNVNIEECMVNNVNTKDFLLKNIILKSGKVSISESKMDLISIEKLFSENLNCELAKNNSKLCYIKDIICKKESILLFTEGFYENLTIKQNIKYLKVDFTTANFISLNLSEELYKFLTNKEAYKFLFISDNLLQNIDTLKILSKMFGDNYEFNLQDECYYWFNNLKLQYLIKNSDFHKKVYYFLILIIGKIFGWGVRLQNIFFSFIFITISFGFVYGYFLNKYHLVIDFHNVKLNTYVDGFLISFLTMLNYFSDFDYQNYIIFIIMIIQSIISIIFLTILTGSIVRKLVR